MSGFLAAIPVLLSIVLAAAFPFYAGIFPKGIQESFHEGGWGMQLILFALLVSVWLIVDRVAKMLAVNMDIRGFMIQLKARLDGGDIVGAEQLCRQYDKPLPRILAAGLAESGRGEHEVQAAMDQVAYAEIPALEKRTGYLALMGNVATLMGLFGTIIGLIHSFSAVGKDETGDNATLLAAGISEAMNCTAFGLLTGIAALFAFSVLNGRTQWLLDEVNYHSLRAYRWWKRAYQNQEAQEPVFTVKPVNAPHAHLMSHTGLLKAGGGGSHKKGVFANLQLTPLIDMFIVLVIFLLLSFNASGDIVRATKNLKLPEATQVQKLERVPIVSITYVAGEASGGIVTLENQEVSTAQELLEDTGPDWKIARLTEELEKMKLSWKVTNPDKPWAGKLIIQCDQNIDFKIVKKVMYSAGIAGYGNILFAVRKAASETAEGS
ncbi:MAG: MotA/TolQ/ExbB proton channel family protein [Deltaproteobacteria bacterium]|nr:MotA/TolQ/ExbB proton channel family protein [Deltaproteobacteria bacterium]